MFLLTERHYLLWLMNITGMTSKKTEKLLHYFKSAENVFFEDVSRIENVLGTDTQLIKQISAMQNEKTIYDLIERLDNLNTHFVTLADSNYPALLRNIYNAPLVLYYKGILPDNRLPCVSIIGSRKCSNYGSISARLFARDLASCGINIISGMAEGADASAHLGALDSNGYTLAVLGSGVDICYPKSNARLMKRISESGCLLSEYPPGTAPLPAYFRSRNRIISGLSYITIVTEAEQRSGTSITVNNALEQGRDIFVVPGSIFSKLSKGTNAMLNECAYPLTSYSDILYHLSRTANFDFGDMIDFEKPESDNFNPIEKSTTNLSTKEKTVYKFIKYDPITIEELILLSGFQAKEILVILTNLEFSNLIKRLPGQKCIRSI